MRLTRELASNGMDARALRLLQRAGSLARVRYGAYAEKLESADRAAHLQLIQATWPLVGENAVLSHGSAAALHDLPIWGSMLQRVSITRPSGGHGERSTHLHAWRAPLVEAEVTTISGMRVTSIERTAVDAAMSLPYPQAVAVMDAALHAGARPGLVAEIAGSASRRKGIRTARAALAFADARAESAGESISRVRMAEAGLPAPELQFTVVDRFGFFVARTDFCWPEKRVVGEFDGRVKYQGSPDEVADVVMSEKRREQAIHDAGWWVVRWDWADLGDRDRLRRRILQGFANARA